MNKAIWTVIVVVIVIGGVGIYLRQKNTVQTKDVMTKEDKMMKDETAMPQKENTMQKEQGAMDKNEDTMMQNSTTTEAKDKMMGDKMQDTKTMQEKPGAYIDYSPAALAEATKNGKTVLFFWAAWCPFCKAANEAFISKAGEIPNGVTVLKTNYDTEKELKTKYGVTYQHTFVQIDSNKNQIAKWSGGDIEALRTNIK